MTRYFKYLIFALVALVAVQFGLHAFGVVDNVMVSLSNPCFPYVASFDKLRMTDLLGGLGALASIPIAENPMGTAIGLGRFAQHYPNEYTYSRIAEGEIPFGRAVEVGTTPEQGKLVGGATGEFIGVSANNYKASLLSLGKYSDKDPLAVHKSGFVTVYVEEAVNAGDPVRVRHTNHASLTAKVAGNFAKTADAGKTLLLEGARFENTVAAAGEAILFLSGSFKTTADV